VADVAQELLVYRPRFEVRSCRLPAGAVPFLDALATGASFAAAFVAAARAQPQAEPAALFSLLLQQGLVVELIESPPEAA
jgi:hypothetical protein